MGGLGERERERGFYNKIRRKSKQNIEKYFSVRNFAFNQGFSSQT